MNPNKPALLPVVLVAAIAVGLAGLAGCKKRSGEDEKPVATAKPPLPPPPPPTPPAPPRADVPFKGTYTKYAEATWKNGRRVRVSNASGAATLHIEAGRVTYAQTYTVRGKVNRVTQVYTFTQEAVRPVGAQGYDVAMVFQSISGDTQSYSPDKNRPKIEARKQAGGWEIGLLTTDNNGVMGGVEFK